MNIDFKLRIFKNDNDLKFDVNEYEDITDFELVFEKLCWNYDGELELDFTENRIVVLSLCDDFKVIYIDIVNLISFLKSDTENEYDLWACEQGSDFHLIHKLNENTVTINFRKGVGCGFPNKLMDDFSIQLDKNEYIKVWGSAIYGLHTNICKYFEGNEDILAQELKRIGISTKKGADSGKRGQT